MNIHPSLRFVTALCAVFALIAPAVAPAAVTMQWVPVGNAGNDPQSSSNRSHSFSEGDGMGAVGYDYQIGQYMVTYAQYATFLNSVAALDTHSLYHLSMGNGPNVGGSGGIERTGTPGSYSYSAIAGMEERPVMFVTWFNAARMANWMHNGQGTGDTETGAYTLNGATSGIILRNPGATVWIPSGDEWFKAAYYNGSTGQYSRFATGTDSINTTMANYDFAYFISTGFIVAEVGTYNHPSFYGTFDQSGNLWEWTDEVVASLSSRGRRGGSYEDSENAQSSSSFNPNSPEHWGHEFTGFRLAFTPEPSRVLMFGFAGLALLARRRRSTL